MSKPINDVRMDGRHAYLTIDEAQFCDWSNDKSNRYD
jgi:hypothetical protein